MQDFHAAGGMGALLLELKDLLHLDCMTVAEKHWVRDWRAACRSSTAVYPFPIRADHAGRRPGRAVRQPGAGGAILKRAAADNGLFEKRAGRWCSNHWKICPLGSTCRISTSPRTIFWWLKNAGPRSASGMPEAGYLPIPKKLAQKGLKDMVRISDARMSGTAFGTVILHITPDAASGGPLALVKSGDRIRLSVKDRKLDLLVSDEEKNRRRGNFMKPLLPPRVMRASTASTSCRPTAAATSLSARRLAAAEHLQNFCLTQPAAQPFIAAS